MRVPGWILYLLVTVPLWVVASGRFHPVQLGWGLLVGIATLPLTWRLFDLSRAWSLRQVVRGIVGFFQIFAFFVPDAILSSLDMARRVVRPVVPMAPGIVAVPMRFRGPVDELVVSNRIILTPGTVLVEVDDERGYVFVHCIDASDPDRVRRDVLALGRRVLRRLYG
jgi:multicomponent Na+:H+ antiporter subunit E